MMITVDIISLYYSAGFLAEPPTPYRPFSRPASFPINPNSFWCRKSQETLLRKGIVPLRTATGASTDVNLSPIETTATHAHTNETLLHIALRNTRPTRQLEDLSPLDGRLSTRWGGIARIINQPQQQQETARQYTMPSLTRRTRLHGPHTRQRGWPWARLGAAATSKIASVSSLLSCANEAAFKWPATP